MRNNSNAKIMHHKEKLEGFAELCCALLGVLNKIPSFKEKNSHIELKILLIATDFYPAAFVHFNYGTVNVKAVSKENVKQWKKTGAQGMIQCTSAQFIELVLGRLNPVREWILRRIKIRGVFGMMKFSRLLL